MSKAREEILERVRAALKDVPDDEKPDDVEVPRTYRQRGELDQHDAVSLFAERVGEYKATVRRIHHKELNEAIAEACRREKVEKLVVPDGFPKAWLPPGVDPLYDHSESPLTHHELDRSDGVITTCALAIATTGTVVLDAGKGQGRRALTLLPDFHICIVREEQVVEQVSEAFRTFEQAVRDDGRPLTFISGPSATSDIELSRVEGVHGPRRLDVVIVSG